MLAMLFTVAFFAGLLCVLEFWKHCDGEVQDYVNWAWCLTPIRATVLFLGMAGLVGSDHSGWFRIARNHR